MGNRAIAMSLITSVDQIPICIAYWSTHVFLALGPKTQRVGLHWRLIAITLAKPQRQVYTSTPCEAYLSIFHSVVQPMTLMKRRTTDALAHVSARMSRMFDA